jgi:hypothetical protein
MGCGKIRAVEIMVGMPTSRSDVLRGLSVVRKITLSPALGRSR